jgi:CheY-like chemotaxis protein
MNLVGNAAKFTDKGGITIGVYPITNEGGETVVRLDVVDTGIGMSVEQQARLFGAFQQADASMTRKFGGTGLGLMISRRLARMLGGDISVKSEHGHGSTFSLTIDPGNVAFDGDGDGTDEEAIDNAFDDESSAVLNNLGGRILLAEDGPDNQRLISFVLNRAGLDVDIVDNGQLAIDKIIETNQHDRPYDVVLMDMQMPVMDGYTAARTLRELGIAVPIVALTAHAMTGDRDKCIDAGCTDYATKPIDRKRLLQIIHRLMKQQVENV